jgi:xylulokinase
VDLLLGIDIGTGSTKGVLVDTTGSVLASEAIAHTMDLPRPGWAEVDAEGMWWGEVCTISAALMAKMPAGASLAGMCVSGVGPCLVLCDDTLRPLRPAILYGVDTRATAEIESLTAELGEQNILDRAGTLLSSQAVGPKLEWVRRHEPDVFDTATGWYGSNSYIAAKLTGEYVMDHHTASQCDPLYDIRAGTWYQPWYADVMGDLAAPHLAWPSEVVGRVTSDAAQMTNLPAGTPVCAGTVDAWAEAFSAGVRRPGDLMLMYGSTMFFVQVLQTLTSHPELWTTAGVDPGTYTLAAGMSTSGSLTSWIQELVGSLSFAELVDEAAAVPPGSGGLLLLPYFAGERTPIFDPRARGVIAGLTLSHKRGHLFRAVYEGIAFGIRQILELLDSDLTPVQRLVAVGGGTQGGLWTQIVSDVTGREQSVPEQTIGASYGDALMAAIGTGLASPETDWAVTGRTVTPNPATRELYDGLYRGYCDLYPATKPYVHQLAQLQEQQALP